MAKQKLQMQDVADILANTTESFQSPALITAPYSAITDMSGAVRKLPDPSKTIRPSMGIERIAVQSVMQLQDEKGPNGESVFAALNDDSQRIRFVGNWISTVDTQGASTVSAVIGDYIEITFYGTGLNLLRLPDGIARTFSVTIDGVAGPTDPYPATGNAVINGRNVFANVAQNMTGTLSLGVHTVKLTKLTSNNTQIGGFEILGNTTAISIPQGGMYSSGRKFTNLTTQTTAYNSGFDGSPTLNGRGGRVVTYVDQAGNVGKVLQQVDAAAAHLTSANHANESVIRIYKWREFGAGRPDDFSRLSGGPGTCAFTLDDGTTTLVGSAVITNILGTGDVLDCSTSGFFTFTFIGTGLDIVSGGNGSVFDNFTVEIDGSSSVGNITGAASPRNIRIASGLPYGTHTVKITRSVNANSGLSLHTFITYGPKKPLIPSGTTEVADYYLMADYSGSSTGPVNAGVRPIPSTGTLRKYGIRELVYSGSWPSILGPGGAAAANENGGLNIRGSTSGDYFSYTFFGTGVEIGVVNVATSPAVTVQLDGVAYTGAATVGGTGTWTPGSSTLSGIGGTSGTRLKITGLSLGVHTIKVTKADGNGLDVIEINVITPIHSPKSNLYADLQNTLPVGSNSLCSNVSYGPRKDSPKAWAQAVGITSSPTNSITTANVPMPDMSVTVKTNGGPLDLSFSGMVYSNQAIGGAYVSVFFYVNGVDVGKGVAGHSIGAGYIFCLSMSAKIQVPAGTHKVDVYWYTGTGTATANGTNRILTVSEE
jgi:hypothetical protein